MTARSERPISRLISWVRPPIRPFTDSRSERVLVEAGSMAYSAVTQPRPEPFRQRGTPSVADAAQSTRVRPNSTSTAPAAWSSQWRVIVKGRRGSSARPSLRGWADEEAVDPGVSMAETLASRTDLLHLGAADAPEPDHQRYDEPEEPADHQLTPLLAGQRCVVQLVLRGLEVDPAHEVVEPRHQGRTDRQQTGQHPLVDEEEDDGRRRVDHQAREREPAEHRHRLRRHEGEEAGPPERPVDRPLEHAVEQVA